MLFVCCNSILLFSHLFERTLSLLQTFDSNERLLHDRVIPKTNRTSDSRSIQLTRKSIISIVVSGVVLLSSGTFFATHAMAQNVRGMRRERHPEIRRAMKALENAKMALQKADRDFSGHRTAAVKDVDAALDECRQALQSDKG